MNPEFINIKYLNKSAGVRISNKQLIKLYWELQPI